MGTLRNTLVILACTLALAACDETSSTDKNDASTVQKQTATSQQAAPAPADIQSSTSAQGVGQAAPSAPETGKPVIIVCDQQAALAQSQLPAAIKAEIAARSGRLEADLEKASAALRDELNVMTNKIAAYEQEKAKPLPWREKEAQAAQEALEKQLAALEAERDQWFVRNAAVQKQRQDLAAGNARICAQLEKQVQDMLAKAVADVTAERMNAAPQKSADGKDARLDITRDVQERLDAMWKASGAVFAK